MAEVFLLPDPERDIRDVLAKLPAPRITTGEELRNAFGNAGADTLWIAASARAVAPLLSAALENPSPRGPMTQRLLVLEEITAAQRALYQERFRPVLAGGTAIHVLPVEEIVEVLGTDHPAEHIVGLAVDAASRSAMLYRGNLQTLVVPFSWFEAPGAGARPDFGDCSIEEFGQVVRFGAYEAATSAILYDFDPEYRKKAQERALELDRSVGGSIRRLRILRGMLQSDFPGISTKEMGRIERGVVQSPHRSTLAAIAERLGVTVDELATY